MKKLLAILLMLSMLLAFAACDSEASNNDDEDEEASENESGTSTKALKNITFESMTVVDNDECSIVIDSIEYDEDFGYELSFSLENKSETVDYNFDIVDTLINGAIEDSVFLYSDVSAGKKAKETDQIHMEDLEKIGCNKITELELTFEVCDADDYSAEPVALETVHIYPYGEEAAEKFTREAQSSDQVLVDNEYVKLSLIECTKDDGIELVFFCENKTNAYITISGDNVSINDYMDGHLYDSLKSGRVCVTTMNWYNFELEELGITADDVETIEFELEIYGNDDSWNMVEYFNDTITINP